MPIWSQLRPLLCPRHAGFFIHLSISCKRVAEYRAAIRGKSDLERTELSKDKTGVFTGAFATNPVNDEKIPVWIADYVLASYGTGAIMAVPAHDERDWEFAQKFGLDIKSVVMPTNEWLIANDPKDWPVTNPESLKNEYTALPKIFKLPSPAKGRAINSGNAEISLDGLGLYDAKSKIISWLEERGLASAPSISIEDWLFSRQRYWGEPISIIWKRDADGNPYHEALPESALPVLPPALED